jgi:hypothetical protein
MEKKEMSMFILTLKNINVVSQQQTTAKALVEL